MNDWAKDTLFSDGILSNEILEDGGFILEDLFSMGDPMNFDNTESSTIYSEELYEPEEFKTFPLDASEDMLSGDCITRSTSSSEDISETPTAPRKKRGRRPNSERGLPLARQRKPPKRRIYEIKDPLQNKELEQKRICAINAKKHRDLQKNKLRELEQQVEEVMLEKASLETERKTHEQRVDQMLKQLNAMKDYLANQAATTVIVLDTAM